MHRTGHKYEQIGVSIKGVFRGEGRREHLSQPLANGALTAHHNHNEQQQRPCYAAAVRHMECPDDGHDGDDDRNNKRKCRKPNKVLLSPPPTPTFTSPSPFTAPGVGLAWRGA